jgi:hypothetical protein
MDTSQRSLDTFVLEYMLKPQFWILGFCLITFWLATIRLATASRNLQRSRSKDSSKDDSKDTSKTKLMEMNLSRVSTPANPTSTANPAPTSNITSNRFQPFFTAWASQFLTTRLRKNLALVAYIAILMAQLLESYWIMVTLKRWTARLLIDWPDHGTWAYRVYYLSAGVMLAIDCAFFLLCCLFALFHLVCIIELRLC